MTASVTTLGLSEPESMSLLVLLCIVVYVSYRYPHLLPGGRGVPPTGVTRESTPSGESRGSDRSACPHCGVENDSVSTYCRNCVRNVWT